MHKLTAILSLFLATGSAYYDPAQLEKDKPAEVTYCQGQEAHDLAHRLQSISGWFASEDPTILPPPIDIPEFSRVEAYATEGGRPLENPSFDPEGCYVKLLIPTSTQPVSYDPDRIEVGGLFNTDGGPTYAVVRFATP